MKPKELHLSTILSDGLTEKHVSVSVHDIEAVLAKAGVKTKAFVGELVKLAGHVAHNDDAHKVALHGDSAAADFDDAEKAIAGAVKKAAAKAKKVVASK